MWLISNHLGKAFALAPADLAFGSADVGSGAVAFATEVVFATAGTPALGFVSDAFGTGTAGTLAAGIAAAVVSVPPGGSSTAASAGVSAGVSAAGVAVVVSVVSAGGNLNCQQLWCRSCHNVSKFRIPKRCFFEAHSKTFDQMITGVPTWFGSRVTRETLKHPFYFILPTFLRLYLQLPSTKI